MQLTLYIHRLNAKTTANTDALTLQLKNELTTSNAKILELENEIKKQSNKNDVTDISKEDEAKLKQENHFLSWALSSPVSTTNRLTNENNSLKQNISNLMDELNNKKKSKAAQ